MLTQIAHSLYVRFVLNTRYTRVIEYMEYRVNKPAILMSMNVCSLNSNELYVILKCDINYLS